MCEPLKGKKDYYKNQSPFDNFEEGMMQGHEQAFDSFVSAVKGLIKHHEWRIDELIERHSPWLVTEDMKGNEQFLEEDWLFVEEMIRYEYESINAIEHWLEDAL